jgi:hypothetical protein
MAKDLWKKRSIHGIGELRAKGISLRAALMNRELRTAFNSEIERYRHILLSCAKRCEWDTFKLNAGKLFDYVDSIEMSELEKRFLKVFRIVMVVLFCALAFAFRINLDSYPELVRLKEFIGLTALAAGSFELYFFLNFRMCMDHKTTSYKMRRERFISNIENDFRNICLLPNCIPNVIDQQTKQPP